MPEQSQPDSPRQKGQASAQISITRAPWADAAPAPASASGSLPRAVSGPLRKPSNPESLQWQEKAPWAEDGPTVLAGIGTMPADIDAVPAGSGSLPQAPTRAPWADGGTAGLEGSSARTSVSDGGGSSMSSLPMTASGRLGSGAFPAGGNNNAAWQQPLHEPGYQPDLDTEPAMPPLTGDVAELANRSWQRPTKRILSSFDLERWLRSDSARSFVGFLLALNEAVRGKKLSDPVPSSPAVDALMKVLQTLDGWVDEIPPVSQSLRYGNPAFRTWHARAVSKAPDMMTMVLPPQLAAASKELGLYLSDSLGNATRIDYGTGHETTFAALLYCLCVVGAFKADDSQALVVKVFARYLQLMRRVQKQYWLEPAGSHGVWGLDDYHFLPFLWGSSQLMGHPSIRPPSISSDDVLSMYSEDYLYLSAVKFVKEVKKGPLGETSPMLHDISGVPGWAKVNAGMIRMYQAEVLGKFPIMQHMLFGSLLTFSEPAKSD